MREISSFIGARSPLGGADRVCFASRSIPPVSATPTAFALRIGQFPLSRRRRPRSLCESVNSPQEKSGKNPCFRQRRYQTHARATHYPAGVQTMRARICSAFSCAMFARVVWLKPRRAAKLPTFALSFAARTRHAWLARLTRARGKSSQRDINFSKVSSANTSARYAFDENFIARMSFLTSPV